MKLIKTELLPRELAVEETLFHVANGYLGVRGNLEEGVLKDMPTVRGCYINGFYDTVELRYPERLYGFPEEAQRLVNLPDVQTMRLFIGEEEFSPFHGELLNYERMLDTDEGVTTRRMRWRSPSGKIADIEIIRMASFVRPELFLTVYGITSENFDGRVELITGIDCDVSNFVDPKDPRVASERIQHIFFDGAEIVGGITFAKCHTGVSKLRLAVVQQIVSGGDIVHEITENGVATCISFKIKSGESLTVEKHTVLSDCLRANAEEHALRVINACVSAGADVLFEEQKDFLNKFWSVSRINITGCPEIRDGMEFNLYQLLQSAGRDAVSSVAAKGISGEGYEGHYFWDTEIYIFPFFLFTQPEIARRLLDFRCNTLDGARAHAKIMGHSRGALYPWRTIAGSECSSYYPSGSAQYHITGDVAHSFLQYYYATNDLEYMSEKAAEVLIETARLWLSAGNYGRDGKFHIHNVTGPDEYTCVVSDNYYTNRCAQYNLRGAVEIYNRLMKKGLHCTAQSRTNFNESELADFTRAANAMFLPYDAELGICAQDGNFLEKPVWELSATPKDKFPLLLHYHPLYLYRHQVCKQADTVLAHFLFEDGVPEDDIRRSYEYYEKITTHDSSLSGCVFGIMASRLGFGQKAYDYFADTVRLDLDNMHGNTKDGLHVANLGGTWLALVCGFAGLRLHGDELHFRFTVPTQWEGYCFCIRYRGSLLRINVTREQSEIKLEKGDETVVFVDGIARRVTKYHPAL